MAFDSLNVNAPDGDAESPRRGDDRIRETREALRERLDVDLYFPEDDPTPGLVDNADTGEHRQATFRERTDPGAVDANKIILYAIEIASKAALKAISEDEKTKVLLKQNAGDDALILNIEAADLKEAGAAALTDNNTIEIAAATGKIQLKAGGGATGVLHSHLATDADQFCDDSSLEIDAAEGLRIKAGYLATLQGQSDQAEGTTDISNASGDWADMTDMTIAITPAGGNVAIDFSACTRHAGTGQYRITIDGAAAVTTATWADSALCNMGLHWLETGLSAEEHTIKVQWKDLTGTIYQDGATYSRVLRVVELAKAP